MICFIEPVAAGNALRVVLEPPTPCNEWRLLRKLTDDISGEDDAQATVVWQTTEADRTAVLDDQKLINGTVYYYQFFCLTGSVWSTNSSVAAVPEAAYTDLSTDVLVVLRDRLDLGLAHEVSQGTLKPKKGKLAVLNAPPLFERVDWPVVTVQLIKDTPLEHFVGEHLNSGDTATGDHELSLGYLSSWRISVTGWSLNPDERISLRQALKRVVLANTEIFTSYGMEQMEFDLMDQEDYQTYQAPVYMVAGTFTCLAPTQIAETVSPIHEVTVTAQGVSNV